MKKSFLIFLFAAAIIMRIAAGGAGDARSASADDWPSRDVTIITGYTAGGDSDYNARMLGRAMERRYNVRFPVINVSGGNASIATTQYRGGPSDGYTYVQLNTASLSGNEATGLVDYGYDAFDPVSIFGRQAGETIIVPAASPYRTFQELIDASRTRPDSIRFGIVTGGAVYIASVIMQQAGARFVYLESGDGSIRVTQLLGGHIDATIAAWPLVMEHVEAGSLRVLATLLQEPATRIQPLLQPTREVIPDLIVNTLYVVLAAKGTPAPIIQKFNADILDIVARDPVFAEECIRFNFQDPWALNIPDTIAELRRQREHFMAFRRFLQ